MVRGHCKKWESVESQLPCGPVLWENQRQRHLEETAAVRATAALVVDTVHLQQPGCVCFQCGVVHSSGPAVSESVVSLHRVKPLAW